MKRPRISGSTRADLYCEDLDVVESEDPDQDLFSSEELLLHTSCGEKKRRLGIEQVKALEKSFEAENKLDPERKLRIARDLALQPRQVAVWFQNRRARWKTKQLERDYIALRTSYDNLAVDCDSLRRDKLTLLNEIKNLKTKLGLTEGDSDDRPAAEMEAVPYKDGSSDSDSSAVLFDENSSYQCGGVSLPPELRRFPEEMEEPKPAELRFDFQLWSDQWKPARSIFPKVEQSFNGGGEISSDLFSGEQHPIFSWYCGDHWS